ncbi:DUF3040 domain-containing protein [Kitasatospora sp. NPDC004531]
MSSPLTARERHLLADIERHLRAEAPRLDRRLDRAPGPVARFGHRPRLLAAAVALLSVVSAAGGLWALADGPARAPALAIAGAAALLCALALRRLSRSGGQAGRGQRGW